MLHQDKLNSAPTFGCRTLILGVFLGVFLLGLFSCGEGPVPNCSSSFVASSTCMSPPGPKSTPGVTAITVKPIPPTPTPSPMPTPSPTPSPTATASPTPPIDYKSLVRDETINYYELVLHGLYSAAYAMLSPERQAHMSLTEF